MPSDTHIVILGRETAAFTAMKTRAAIEPEAPCGPEEIVSRHALYFTRHAAQICPKIGSSKKRYANHGEKNDEPEGLGHIDADSRGRRGAEVMAGDG